MCVDVGGLFASFFDCVGCFVVDGLLFVFCVIVAWLLCVWCLSAVWLLLVR